MMKTASLAIIALFTALRSFSIDLPMEIVNAISSGNAVSLSRYFNTSVEMTVLEQEGVYSKTQAEMIVKDFFTQNTPKQFKILHQGGKESSKYAIGSLTSETKTFRITLFFKTEGTQFLIHQFRIEAEYVE
jgi:hypothetical protein